MTAFSRPVSVLMDREFSVQDSHRSGQWRKGSRRLDGDGKVDAQDAQFADLRLWVDANTDGLTQSGELKTLAEVGVAGLMVSYDESRIAQNGNILDGAGSFVKTDGSVGRMSDAWFVMAEPELLKPSSSRSNCPMSCPHRYRLTVRVP